MMDQDTSKTFQLGGRSFPKITWYKEKGLRSLYVWLLLAVLTSATNGYDGSMMNGLQALDQWKNCKLLSAASSGTDLCLFSVQ